MLKSLNKKGQGLSLNTIIIAIMVIIVLVIIILITTGQLQKFTEGVNSNSGCVASGGYCADSCNGNELKVANDECTLVGKVCCKSTTYSGTGDPDKD